MNSDICHSLSLFDCFSHVFFLSLLLNIGFILFCSMCMHKTLPALRKFAGRCKSPAPGHILTVVQDLFMMPMTGVLGHTEGFPWALQLPCADYTGLRSAHSWILPPPGLAGPQRRCFDGSCLLLQLYLFAQISPSPRRGCLISKLAGFNPSSSVPG